MKVLEGKNILVISSEAWGTSHLSKHHYALALQKAGNQVFFLNPPAQGAAGVIETDDSGVRILNYRQSIKGARFLPAGIQNVLAHWDQRKIESLIHDKIDIIWSFDASRRIGSSKGKSIRIYHAADHSQGPLIESICAGSHLVLSVGEDLLPSTIKGVKNIGHGVEEILRPTKVKLPGVHVHKVVYVGNLLIKYINRSLIDRLIATHSEVDFIFAGSYNQGNLNPNARGQDPWIADLQHKENVHLLGEIEPGEIPSVLAEADVLICAYDNNKYAERLKNSHKLLEYLMSGKVVVSNWFPGYPKTLVHLCENEDSFLSRFKKVLDELDAENASPKQTERRQWASQFTYQKQLNKIDGWLAAYE